MTRETSIYWPEALGCPLRSGYSGQAEDPFQVVEVVDGPPRMRLLTNEPRRLWTVGYLWTWQQLQVFEAFVASDLNMGLSWFRMDQLTGSGMTPHFCHLIGDYTIRASEADKRFEVSFDVEAYLNDNPIPPPFEFDATYDGGVVGTDDPADIIDARAADDPPPGDRIDSLVPGT